MIPALARYAAGPMRGRAGRTHPHQKCNVRGRVIGSPAPGPPTPAQEGSTGLAAPLYVGLQRRPDDARDRRSSAWALRHEPAVPERLTQSLHGVAPELGELVQEQYAVVGQRSRMSPAGG
jgi:hypothetical protein